MPRQAEGPEWGFPNRATPFGSPAYYALRFSPAARLEYDARLLAWYGLVREIAAQPRDPGVARLKLDWWRSELARVAAGSPSHPLSSELVGLGLGADVLPTMQEVVDGAEWELRSPQPDGLDDFVRRCRNADGLLFVLLADNAPDLYEACLAAGAFCAALERIRRAALEPSALPNALDPARLCRMQPAERTAACEAALDRTNLSAPAMALLPPAARRLTALAQAMRNKLRRRGYPCAGTVLDRPPIAHLWTAWRCR